MPADHSDLVLLSASARRRNIFERTKARYSRVGIGLDDPEYLDLIEQWITGELTMPDAARRWDALRISRAKTRKSGENSVPVLNERSNSSDVVEHLDGVPPVADQ